MPLYHFAIRNDAHDNEDLGFLAMANDNEAIAFGQNIIRDIMQEHTPQHTGSALVVTEGKRAAGSVSFDFEIGQPRARVK